MNTAIRTRIVKIGNSQGIRIPKPFLGKTRVGDEVQLEMQPEQIVIRPTHQVRQGWEEQFRIMAERGDDKLLDGDVLVTTTWDDEEWVWSPAKTWAH